MSHRVWLQAKRRRQRDQRRADRLRREREWWALNHWRDVLLTGPGPIDMSAIPNEALDIRLDAIAGLAFRAGLRFDVRFEEH